MSLVTLTVTYTIYTTHKHINIHLHYYTLITVLGIYALNFLSKLYSGMMTLELTRTSRKKRKKIKTFNVTAVRVKTSSTE